MSNDYSDHVAVPRFFRRVGPACPAAAAVPALQIARFIEAHRHEGYRIANLDPLDLAPRADVLNSCPPFTGSTPTRSGRPTRMAFPPPSPSKNWSASSSASTAARSGSTQRRAQRSAPPLALLAHGSGAAVSACRAGHGEALLRRLVEAEMWERLVAARNEHAKRFSLGRMREPHCAHRRADRASRQPRRAADVSRHAASRAPEYARQRAGFPAEQMLACLDPESDIAATLTDLAYHLGSTARKATRHGNVDVFLAHKPSHLQSVYPVVSGMARAWQDEHQGAGCVPVRRARRRRIRGPGHRDGNAEPHAQERLRAGRHDPRHRQQPDRFHTPNLMDVCEQTWCTDVARMIDAPVIHVNADHPEDVLRAARIAFDYRMKHGADIVVDLIGYRRLGHSEHDIPAITQPLTQAAVGVHPTVTELYHDALSLATPLDTLRDEALRKLEAQQPESGGAAAADAITHSVANTQAASFQTRLAGAPSVVTKTLTRALPASGCTSSCAISWRAGRPRSQAKAMPQTGPFAENLAYATLLEDGHGVRLSA